MKNVLVTGGAGYIGSVLVSELLNRDFKVIVLDNFMYRQQSLAHLIRNKNLEIVFGDVRDNSTMQNLVSRSDVILPLAAIVGAPACAKDPVTASSINKDATLWLLSKIGSGQQVIMPTTNSAYGSGGEDNYCDENSSLFPLSQYAKEKVIIEEELMKNSNATSLRLATVFGISSRMRLDLLVNNFVHRAVKDKFVVLFEGHFKRNYVHVKDVAAAFAFAIENPEKVSGQVFNFGLSSANISKIELCEEIKKLIPDFTYLEAPFARDPDQRNYLVSNLKFENVGMKARITLKDGIEELIKGMNMYHVPQFANI